jgi:regulator of RNase E activity RraA
MNVSPKRCKGCATSAWRRVHAIFKRGLRNVFIQGIARLTRRHGGNLVGPAFTLRNIPAREDLDQINVFENPEHPQRKAIESVPPGTCSSSTVAAKRALPPAGRS